MDNLISFIDVCFEENINNISIYMLSDLNLQRSQEDLIPVFEAETCFVQKHLPDLCNKWSCRVIPAGNLLALPKSFSSEIINLCNYSKKFSDRCIYLLFAYSPLDEVRYACINANNDKVEIKHFWVDKFIDCIIRTAGGPTLLSNFLPLQSGYAQIHMCDEYFNDLGQGKILNIIQKTRSTVMKRGT
jgi:undecaprenyl diphosphate synthase